MEYLNFSRRDRIAIIALVFIISTLSLFPYFIDRHHPEKIEPNDILSQAIDSLASRDLARMDEKINFDPLEPALHVSKGKLFHFDPNTLPAEGWKQLGLNDRTIKTIERYRSKGGRFYKPEDLKRIWGLPEGFYDRVKDHIEIKKPENRLAGRPFDKPSFNKHERIISRVHINDSDTSHWISLHGIGSKLAARIVAFREKLGGFHSIEQVKETYGLADSTFQKIKSLLVEGGEIKKININTVSKEELKKHPYFKWNMVNAMIEYRNQHGRFKDIEEIKNISLMDDVFFEKVKPYLVIEQ